MSLLTSPNTNKQTLKFLNKMQRHYHRRGASQYIPKPKEKQQSFTTKISTESLIKIKELLAYFMESMSKIVREFSMLDHYAVLQILRKNQFFSDVAILIQSDLYLKIQSLERQILQKEEKITRLKKQHRSRQYSGVISNEGDKLQKLQNFSNKNLIKYNPSKTVASNIYCHAKAMNQQDFLSFYNKISLSNPITLKKVQNQNIGKFNDQSMLISKVNELIGLSKNHHSQQQINQIIEQIKQSNNLSSKNTCKNPCCQQKVDQPDTRLNKAKTLMSSNFSKPSKDVYKADKFEQYFNRYYKDSSFHVQDITSLSRTKMQQMERIENQYRKNLKARKKYENHHRYSLSCNKQ